MLGVDSLLDGSLRQKFVPLTVWRMCFTRQNTVVCEVSSVHGILIAALLYRSNNAPPKA